MGDVLQSMAGMMGAFAIVLFVGKSMVAGIRRGDLKWPEVEEYEEDEDEDYEEERPAPRRVKVRRSV